MDKLMQEFNELRKKIASTEKELYNLRFQESQCVHELHKEYEQLDDPIYRELQHWKQDFFTKGNKLFIMPHIKSSSLTFTYEITDECVNIDGNIVFEFPVKELNGNTTSIDKMNMYVVRNRVVLQNATDVFWVTTPDNVPLFCNAHQLLPDDYREVYKYLFKNW
jgi:uncharacterized protein YdcH (DUF465 family)